MIQPGLFDPVEPFPNCGPIAANADPATSHITGREITESGLRGRQKLGVLVALRSRINPPTSAELAQLMHMDRHMVARRLPDLKHDGLVEQGEMRTCNVTGRKAVTWRVK
jgi:DNA-binding HxlR family transcriptional regulator